MSATQKRKQPVGKGRVEEGRLLYYRYLPLPNPIAPERGRRGRSRIVFRIYDRPEHIGTARPQRGLYLSIRGFPDADHSAYALCDSKGRELAEVFPVPMESWQSARLARSVRDAVLAACGRILADFDPQLADTPDLRADYLGFFPLEGVDVDAYNAEADRWALPEIHVEAAESLR